MTDLLVTGAGGFLGRAVSLAAREAMDRVEGAGHACERSVDFRILEDVRTLVDDLRPRAVVHLAGTATLAELLRDPTGGNQNVVQPAVNLLEALADAAPGSRLVLVSPCEVYGRATRLPIDERCPLAPVDLYSAARAAVEHMARVYAARGVTVITARVFHFTGPGQDERWPLGAAARAAARGAPVRLGNLDARRDFSDVRDIARGLVTLATLGAPGEVYNLCSGRGAPLRELAERVAAGRVPVEHDPALDVRTAVPVFLGTAAKAEALGWQRRFTLEDTLRELAAGA